VRIAFLADAPYPHTWRWVEHFVSLGHECHVVSFRPAEIAGATVHHIRGVEKVGKAAYLLRARRVKGLLQALQPDLLHALHLTSYGFLAALSGVRPLIISPIGTDILEAPRLTPFHNWLTRYALARASAISATGLHLATQTTRYAPAGAAVTVVPYGVDLDRFAPISRQPGSALVIGAVARLSPEKGIADLLEAFAELRRRSGGDVRLRIAGDGPERSRLESQIERLEIADAVQLVGWVDYADIPAFLNALDFFAMPSVYEGFGVAAVEAMACGLPVVASDVFGIPDVVQDGSTGYLVPPRSQQALAEALGKLVADEDARRRFGRAGREYVAAHYDWQHNTRQMERLYARVLARSEAEVSLTGDSSDAHQLRRTAGSR